jgi:hypothetical protein
VGLKNNHIDDFNRDHFNYKFVFFKKTDEYDEEKDNEYFSGWEREEADNETFYLVFITNQNKKWYFSEDDIDTFNSESIYMMQNEINGASICKLNDEKIILVNEYNRETEFYLTFDPNADDIYSSHEKGIWNSVCLTESINNHYVLK